MNMGMGRTPLTWQELQAMESSLAVKLTPWEAEVIIDMSRSYCAYAAGSDKNEPAPYVSTEDPKALAIERGRQNEHFNRST